MFKNVFLVAIFIFASFFIHNLHAEISSINPIINRYRPYDPRRNLATDLKNVNGIRSNYNAKNRKLLSDPSKISAYPAEKSILRENRATTSEISARNLNLENELNERFQRLFSKKTESNILNDVGRSENLVGSLKKTSGQPNRLKLIANKTKERLLKIFHSVKNFIHVLKESRNRPSIEKGMYHHSYVDELE